MTSGSGMASGAGAVESVAGTGSPAAGKRNGLLSPRFIDRGAIFAGVVGIGMAVVIAIAFALIIPVQTLVFIAALLGGVLIGAYANQRSNRWRPLRRVFLNAAWAALVTGASLALLWAILRLAFVQFDSGAMPDGTYLGCDLGPDCTWQRYLVGSGVVIGSSVGFVDEAAVLMAAGVTDGASFYAYFLANVVLAGAGLMILLAVVGALLAAGVRGLQAPPPDAPVQGTFIPRSRG